MHGFLRKRIAATVIFMRKSTASSSLDAGGDVTEHLKRCAVNVFLDRTLSVRVSASAPARD
jgi:hypothetical protein